MKKRKYPMSSKDTFKVKSESAEPKKSNSIINILPSKFSNTLKSVTSETTLYDTDLYKIGSDTDRNEKEEIEKTILCSNCIRKAKFRCNLCKTYYSCSNPSIHEIEWKNHIVHCPKVLELYNNENNNINGNNHHNEHPLSPKKNILFLKEKIKVLKILGNLKKKLN